MARWLIVLFFLTACDRHVAAVHPTVSPSMAAPQKRVAPTEREDPPVQGTVEGRVLTEQEIAVLGAVFGVGIDTTVVRVADAKFAGFQGGDTYMTPENTLYAPGDLYREDFAAPGTDPYTVAVFVHEMTHVWQHQSGIDLVAAGVMTFVGTDGDYMKAYPYTLTSGRDLTEYGIEQQASILEDWYLLRSHGSWPASFVDAPGDLTSIKALYDEVLAAFVADPTYARALSPDELLRRHAEATGRVVPDGDSWKFEKD